MLFHVTMTHTEDNCPVYHREKLGELLAAFANLRELGKKLDVKSHFNVMCGLDHVGFALLEADSLNAVTRYVFSVPIHQKTSLVPVMTLEDAMAMGKAIEAQGQA